jgi:hypothetical protein
LDTNADFTISAWVKPDALGGVVLAQDGTHGTGFVLYPDANIGQWVFGMPTTDGTDPSYDTAHNINGPVQLGVWTHLTATYKQSTGTMALYINGNPSGTVRHTTTWNAMGRFEIGQQLYNDTHRSFFNGQIANVQVWNQTLNPLQAATLSGTPGYILIPSDGTHYTSGSTWSSRCATASFNNGQLAITMICTGQKTVTFGNTGNTGAYLTLQTDGNLVSYTQTGTPIWASGTQAHPDDTLFLQEDGNLVIYDRDGTPIWSSGTSNYGVPSIMFYPNNTRYPSGSTWSARCTTMTFNSGQIALTMKCTRSGTTTFGTTGNTGAYLTLQTDGNLVSYTQTGTPIWTSNTNGHNNDTLRLQDDGNLVIYDSNAAILWSSNTNN